MVRGYKSIGKALVGTEVRAARPLTASSWSRNIWQLVRPEEEEEVGGWFVELVAGGGWVRQPCSYVHRKADGLAPLTLTLAAPQHSGPTSYNNYLLLLRPYPKEEKKYPRTSLQTDHTKKSICKRCLLLKQLLFWTHFNNFLNCNDYLLSAWKRVAYDIIGVLQ